MNESKNSRLVSNASADFRNNHNLNRCSVGILVDINDSHLVTGQYAAVHRIVKVPHHVR
ncbi:hypothetical protein HB860_19505 [Aeromonas sp. 3925]|uniref:hypothetical protein n=1 Tax=Aeromonas genomosp. paramedia TaxID=3086176 RepID=UPI001FFDA59D|nr:hypothetical protein [Aeromonas genomosp. paramedia]MCK2086108.1 hypothetical protein [Aeromonas genomosp. paramedia]